MTQNSQDNDDYAAATTAESPQETAAVGRNRKSVEDHWRKSLTRRDVDDEEADRVVRLIQSHPKLGFGDPTKDEVEELTKRGIEEVDLEAVGIDDPDIVREELVEALHDGLAGSCPGPMSLTTPYHIQSKEAGVENPTPIASVKDEPMTDTDRDKDDKDTEEQSTTTAGEGDTESIGVDEEILEDPDPAVGGPAGGDGGDPAPDAAGQTGGGQPAQGMGFAADEQADQPSQQGGGGGGIDPDEVEFEELVGRQIAGYMLNQRVDAPEEGETVELSREELVKIVGTTAEEAADSTLNHLQQYLYGHMDENARDMVFEETIKEPTRVNILRALQQAQNQ